MNSNARKSGRVRASNKLDFMTERKLTEIAYVRIWKRYFKLVEERARLIAKSPKSDVELLDQQIDKVKLRIEVLKRKMGGSWMMNMDLSTKKLIYGLLAEKVYRLLKQEKQQKHKSKSRPNPEIDITLSLMRGPEFNRLVEGDRILLMRYARLKYNEEPKIQPRPSQEQIFQLLKHRHPRLVPNRFQKKL